MAQSTTGSTSQARVEFRMPEALKEEVEQAAAMVGLSLTAFFAEAALERAREVKRRHALTLLNDAERDAFISLMTRPAQSNEALKRLMRTEVAL